MGRLVVFGAGYVGGYVALHAAVRGLRVTALTRNAGKAIALREAGIEVVVADLAERAWMEQIPAGVDYVLNSVSSGGGGLETYRHSYVEGMRRVAEWSKANGIGTLVYTSSTSVYPQGDGVEVDETTSTVPVHERAAVLLEAEKLARGMNARRTFILRLAGIYGPGRHYLLDQISRGESLAGTGDHRLNLAHRDDIAAAVMACLNAPTAVEDGIYNIVDDFPTPKRVVANWLASQLKLPASHFDPHLASGRRPTTPDRVIINRKFKQALGWKPIYPDYRSGYRSLLSR